MRFLLFSFVFLLGWVPVSRAEESPNPPFVGLVTADRVNLRAGPGRSSEILFQFSKGSKVSVVAQRESWYAVQLPSEVSVYVAKEFLHLEEKEGQVQGNRVHVRAGPGQAFTSLGFLSSQEKVAVREVLGEWVKIEPPVSCRGWVSKAYVTFLQSISEEPLNGNPRGISADSIEGSQGSGGEGASQR